MLLELIVVGALAGVIMKRTKKKRLRRFLKRNVQATPGSSLRTQGHAVANNTFTGTESYGLTGNLASPGRLSRFAVP